MKLINNVVNLITRNYRIPLNHCAIKFYKFVCICALVVHAFFMKIKLIIRPTCQATQSQ